MIIYQTSPQDFFEYMTPVKALFQIEDTTYDSCDKELFVRFNMETLRLLMRCAYEVARAEKSCWEGDFRGDEIYLFSLPDPDNSKVISGVIWKQDNNGTTFICSPVLLPWIDDSNIIASIDDNF